MSKIEKKSFISGLVESHIDPQVYEDVLRVFAKETVSMPGFGNLAVSDVPKKHIERAEYTETEISPFRKIEISCDDEANTKFIRQDSTYKFNSKNVSLNTIKQLLINLFAINESGHRPYASAGGLYPVEPLVFLFNDRVDSETSLISGCYHFRPVSKRLQLIKKLELNDFLENYIEGLINKEEAPGFAIVYVAHIGKAIFKYRYRGYRHSAMEVGSMYQQATMVAESLGLRTTAWSSFSEPKLLYNLGLNHNIYLPLTMQLFGYTEPK